MGNIESTFLRVCGSALKRKKRPMIELKEEEESNFIDRNNDGYFQREDFQKIRTKFPEYQEWMEHSLATSLKEKPKQKRIKWKPGELIGSGSFGRVMMGFDVENGCMMAVKQVQIGIVNTAAQQERIKSLEVEIEILSQFKHNNIVRYYGSERTKDTFNIFLEYISGGTIASLLDKYGPFNENIIRVYTRQILQGLEYLHVRNTIHRDIKGANVLVDNSGVCKLTDFGTAKRISCLVEGESKYLPSIRGTVNWMAPEVIKQTTLGRYCDIWSVGCTVLEMATGKAPWSQLLSSDANCVSVLYQIAQAKSPPPIPAGLSSEAVDFLNQCFKINPKERPNVVKLLSHRFITGIDNFGKQLDDSTAQEYRLSNSPLAPNKTKKLKMKSKLSQFASKVKSASSIEPMINTSPFTAVPASLQQLSQNSIVDKENQYLKQPASTNSIYEIGSIYAVSNPPVSNTIKEEDSFQSSIGSLQKLQYDQIDSYNREQNNQDRLQFDQLFNRGTITSRDTLDPTPSQAPIKIATGGSKTGSKPNKDIKLSIDVDGNANSRFDLKRNTEARSRPLGRNRRIDGRKNGYANLSEDESFAGTSYLVAGSPITINENSDDKWNNQTSRTNPNSVVVTPNGGAFPWPEIPLVVDAQENVQKSNVNKPAKIEEEEKEDESMQDKIILDLNELDQEEQNERIQKFRESLNGHTNYHKEDNTGQFQEEDSIHNMPDLLELHNIPAYTIKVLPDKEQEDAKSAEVDLDQENNFKDRNSVVTFGVRSSLSNNLDEDGNLKSTSLHPSSARKQPASPVKFVDIQGISLAESAAFGVGSGNSTYNAPPSQNLDIHFGETSRSRNTSNDITDEEGTEAAPSLFGPRGDKRYSGERARRIRMLSGGSRDFRNTGRLKDLNKEQNGISISSLDSGS